jgi:membrane-bound lytic murein transglycosylase D
MRRIVADPGKYGLEFGSLQNQPYFVKVDVGGQIDLELAADLASMSKEDFLSINPGFKRRVTDPNGPHHLLIPVENEQSFLHKLASLPDSQRVPVVYYRVRKGDTLNKVAQRYGISVNELRTLNNLKSKSIRPGQEILLRGSSSAIAAASQSADFDPLPAKTTSSKSNAKYKTYTVRSGDTLWSIAQRFEVDPTVLASTNKIRRNAIRAGQKLRIPGSDTQSTSRSATSQERLSYTVRNGDTLGRIAEQFRVDIKQLMNWNNLSSASDIKAGQHLVLYIDDSRRAGG